MAPPRVNYKTIALPTSHGGWGFLLEPLLLGLIVAPTLAGGWLSLAAIATFLVQQPLKIAVSDAWRQRRYPRSGWAERFAFGYGLIALIAFGLALFTTQHPFWLPLVLAAPLAVIQLAYDVKNRGRDFIPELAGATALGAIASALALAAGWSLIAALMLWLLLCCRTIPSIIYVRAKLRFERGVAVAPTPIWATHLLAILIIATLAYWGLIPWLPLAVLVILLIRAVVGLLPHRRPVRARTVGFQEMGYGLLMVGAAALGYFLGW